MRVLRSARSRRIVRSVSVAVVAILVAASSAEAQRRTAANRYDDVFRKYSKRYFGVGFDWRLFKAQGLTESNLEADAVSWVGAKGIMQLMPGTFREVSSKNPEIAQIDDPEWNIAAGIFYDRTLWRLWEKDSVEAHRREFMFASYNAGRATIRNAQAVARRDSLDYRAWPSIEQIAPRVSRWRYRETLGYVRKIDSNFTRLDEKGNLKRPGR
jgi:membrane-bound lytic murein transglycosylase F